MGHLPERVIMEGGSLEMTHSFSSARDVMFASGGEFTLTSGSIVDMGGMFSGTGNLIKGGAGTLILSGANTYDGSTIIKAGTLQLSTAGSVSMGTPLTIDDGGILDLSAGFGTLQISDLRGEGAVHLNDNTLDVNGGDFSGVISGVGGSLIKTGDGSLILSGHSTYTHRTTINGGIVSVSSDDNLGDGAAPLDLDGGTLLSTQGFTSSRKVVLSRVGTIEVQNTPLTLVGAVSGSGSLTKMGVGTLILRGANTYSGGTTIREGILQGQAENVPGDVINEGVLAFDQTVDAAYAGLISGSGSLVKEGAGVLTLVGANTYSGGTTVRSGELRGKSESMPGNVINEGVLVFDQKLNATFSGLISGSGSLVKEGTGTLTLLGENTYTGDTAVKGGMLKVSYLPYHDLQVEDGQLNVAGGTGTIKVAVLSGQNSEIQLYDNALEVESGSFSGVISGHGAMLRKTGGGMLVLSGKNQYDKGTSIGEGILSVSSDSNLGDPSGTLEFNGGLLRAADGFTCARKIALTGAGEVEVTGSPLTLSGQISGIGSFTKSGLATLVLEANNSYSGGTHLVEGVVSISSDTNLGNGGGAVTFNGGSLRTAGGFTSSRQMNLMQTAFIDVTKDPLILEGVLSGSGSLRKEGSGKLVLNGVNTYAGGTTVMGGVLSVDHFNNLGSGGCALDGGTLNATSPFSYPQEMSVHAGGTIDVDPGAILVLEGAFSGSGTFTKAGLGVLRFSGLSTYSGNMILSNGRIELMDSDVLSTGTSDLTVHGGKVVVGSGTGARKVRMLSGGGLGIQLNDNEFEIESGDFAGVIAGDGAALKKTGSSTLALSGANTYTGGTEILGGTLSVGADTHLGNGLGDVTFDGGDLRASQGFMSSRAFTLNQAARVEVVKEPLILSGVVSGTGQLNKIGSGTLTLQGSNTYSGGTLLSGGTLSVEANEHLGDPLEALSFNGGTLSIASSFVSSRPIVLLGSGTVSVHSISSFGVDAVISDAGSLSKEGMGTLILSKINTYTGDTHLNEGTLLLAGVGSLGEGRLVINGGTFALETGAGNKKVESLTGSYGSIELNDNRLEVKEGSFAGIISGSGGALKKTGTHPLSLYGNNTYTGGTLIHGGQLKIVANNNLGDLSGGIDLDGGALYATASITCDRSISLTGHGEMVADPNHPWTLSGVLDGAGVLKKSGSGTLTLTGVNSYTGGSRLSAGQLNVSADANLGSASSPLDFQGGTLQASASFSSSRDASLHKMGMVQVDSDVTLTMHGIFSGSDGLSKEGEGRLILGGNNTYLGQTIVDGGVLELARSGVLGARSDLTLNRGRFVLAAGAQTKEVGLLGGGGGGIQLNDNTLDVEGGMFSGIISGHGGSLHKTGGRTLTLSGHNTYARGTTISGGILSVSLDEHLGDLSGTVTFDGGELSVTSGFASTRDISFTGNGTIEVNGSPLTLWGELSGSGSLVKSGDDVLALRGINTWSGGIDVLQGSLRVFADKNLGSGTSPIRLDGGTLEAAESLDCVRGVDLLTSTSRIQVSPNVSLIISGVVSGSSDLTKEGEGRLELSNVSTYSGDTILNGGTLELSGLGTLSAGGDLTVHAGNLSIAVGAGTKKVMNLSGGGGGIDLNDNILELEGGTFSGVISGDLGTLKKTGSSSLTLSGYSNYGNGTILGGGTVEVSIDQHLGDPAGYLCFDGGHLIASEGFNAARDVILNQNGEIEVARDVLHLSGVLSGVGALKKKGSGLLLLSASNTYSGGTDLSKGTLSVSSDDHLGTGSLTFTEGTLRITSSFAFDRTLLIPGTGSIDVNESKVLTLGGTLSGTGKLRKQGMGTLIVSGVNPYEGELIVERGALQLLSSGTLGNSNLTLTLNGGSFTIESGGKTKEVGSLKGSRSTIDLSDNTFKIGSGDFSGIISGQGASLHKVDVGVLTLSGDNRCTGDTKLSGGVLSVSSDHHLGKSDSVLLFDGGTLRATEGFFSVRPVSLKGSGAVEVTGDPLTLSGVLSGVGDLTKKGGGTLVLDRINTYSGGTTFERGFVSVIEDENLGIPSSTLTFDGGGLIAAHGFTSARAISFTAGGEMKVERDPLILSGVLDGVGGLTKSGPGTLILSAHNTYQGGTTLKEGAIRIDANHHLGNSVSVLNLDGGTFQTDHSFSLNREVSLVSSGTIEIKASGVVSFDQVVSGSGTLIKKGSGTLELAKANTYSGETIIEEGILKLTGIGSLGGASDLTLNGGQLVVEAAAGTKMVEALSGSGGDIQLNDNTLEVKSGHFSGIIAGSSGTLKKIGSGALTLEGSNTYANETVIQQGELHIFDDSQLGSAVADLRFDGGEIVAQGFTSARNVVFSQSGWIRVGEDGLTLAGVLSGTGPCYKKGEGTLVLSASNTHTGGIHFVEGSVSVAQDAHLGDTASTLTFDGGTLKVTSSFSSARNPSITSSGTIDVHDSESFVVSGVVSGAGNLTKQGEGTLVLSGVNTYSGKTVVNGGRLTLSGSGTLGMGRDLTLHAGNVVIAAGAGTKQIDALHGSGSEIDLTDNMVEIASGDFGGVIAGSSGTLKKTGSGTLELSGHNTYAAKTLLSGGILSVSSQSHLGDDAAILEFDGGRLLTTSGFTSSRNILLTQTGDIEVSGSTVTLSGVLSGSGGVVKRGLGALILGGVNTYSGGTVLREGALSVDEDHSLGNSSSLLTFDGGELLLTRTLSSSRNISLTQSGKIDVTQGVATLSGILSGSGSLTKQGGGELQLSGVNTYTGKTVLSEGRLAVQADSGLGDIASTVEFDGGILRALQGFTSSRNFSFIREGDIEVDDAPVTLVGVISGVGGLRKKGAGTLVLSGVNTFSGGSHFIEGRVSVGADVHLGDGGSGLHFRGGTLLTTQSFASPRMISLVDQGTIEVEDGALTLSGILSGTGSLVKTGVGRLVLSGTNTYTGGTTISRGTLQGTVDSVQGDVVNNGSLLLIQGSDATYLGAITGTGFLLKEGMGTLTLSQKDAYDGTMILREGTLKTSCVGKDGLRLYGGVFDLVASSEGQRTSLLIGSNATLDLNDNALDVEGGEFEGIITGTKAQLGKVGSKTLVLSGVNTYAGGTRLDGGALSVSQDHHLGSIQGNLSFNGGTLLATQGFASDRQISLQGVGTVQVSSDPLTLSGALSGKGALVKSGAGTLILSGVNSYVGGTTIEAGVLQINHNENLGGHASDLTFQGGTLLVTQGLRLTRNVLLSAAGTIEVRGAPLTVPGIVSGHGALVKSGTGMLILNGVNTYGGGTTLAGGILSISGDANLGSSSSALTFDGGDLHVGASFTSSRNVSLVSRAQVEIEDAATLTLSGVVSGASDLTKSGLGTLILSGVNTYTGRTTIDRGTLELTGSGTLGSGSHLDLGHGQLVIAPGAGTKKVSALLGEGLGIELNDNTLEVESGEFAGIISGVGGALKKKGIGELTLSGSSTYSGGTTVDGGVLSISSDSHLGSSLGKLTLNGAKLLVTESFHSPRDVSLTGSAIIAVDTGRLTVSGILEGSGILNKEGAGALVLDGVNTYSGGTVLKQGALVVSSDANLGDGLSDVTLSGGTLNANASFSTSRSLIFSGDGTIDVTLGSFFTLSGVLSNSGSVIKSGGGTLQLTRANTYSGRTVIHQGVLELAGSGVLGTGSRLDITQGRLDIASGAGTKSVDELNGGGLGIVLNDNTFEVSNGTFSGLIQGSGGALTKKGSGTLELSGSNTYTGGTTISGGMLSIDSDSCLGDRLGSLTLDGGTLGGRAPFTSSRDVTLAGAGEISVLEGGVALSGTLSGSGALTKGGKGTLMLTGQNTFSGGMIISEGVVALDADQSLGSSASSVTFSGGVLQVRQSFTSSRSVLLTSDGTFDVDHSVLLEMSGVFSGAGGLNKQGEGTLELSGVNTYSGDTTVSKGTLALAGGGTLGLSKNLTLNGGNASITSGAGTKVVSALNGVNGEFNLNDNEIEVESGTFSGVIAGVSGALKKTGGGTLTLSGESTYGGGTTVRGGVLSVGSNRHLGAASTPLTLNGGTLLTTLAFDLTRDLSLGGAGTIEVAQGVLTLSGEISGSGSLKKSGVGTLVLSHLNIQNGNTILSEGALSVHADSNLGSSASNLEFDGGTLLTTSGFTSARNLAFTGSGTIEVATDILTLSGVLSGASSLKKKGLGTLILSGVNTYAGGTFLEEGLLIVHADQNLGNSAGALSFDGGRLQVASSFSTPRNFSLPSTADIEIDSSTSLTASGVFSGSGQLIKRGDGTLTLSGANTYTGPTVIEAGALELTGMGTLGSTTDLNVQGGQFVLAAGGNTKGVGKLQGSGSIDLSDNTLEVESGEFAGVIMGSAGTLKKIGIETLTLTGSNTYANGTVINQGQLRISSDDQLGDSAGTITLSGGELLALAGLTSARNVVLSGSSQLNVQKDQLTLSGVLSGAGQFTKSGHGILALEGTNTYTGGTNIARGRIRVSQNAHLGGNAADLIFDGGELEVISSFSSARSVTLTSSGVIDVTGESTNFTIDGVISGLGSLSKEGAGSLTLTGTNTHGGQITVKAGSLVITSSGLFGGAQADLNIKEGSVTVLSGGNVKALRNLQGSGAGIELSDNTLSVEEGDFSGVISGRGATLKKTGAGVLILSGNNTYTHGTNIDGGVLNVSSDLHLGDAAGAVTFNGGSLRVAGSFASTRAFTLTGSGEIEVTQGALTLSGVVSGSGSLKKEGEGTLVLSGINTYSGGTTISKGFIHAASDENLGTLSSSLQFAGGGLLASDGFTSARNVSFTSPGEIKVMADPLILSGVLSGSGSLEKSGAGTLSLSAVNTYSGDTLLSEGVLSISADHNLGDSASSLHFDGGILLFTQGMTCPRDVLLVGNGEVDVAKDEVILSGKVSGAGTLKKRGSGTLVIQEENIYEGGTTMSDGVVVISKDQNLGHHAAPVRFEGGTLELAGGFHCARHVSLAGSGEIKVNKGVLTLSGPILGAGSLVKSGVGVLALEGDNTYTGTLTLKEGVVSISDAKHLGGKDATLGLDGGTLITTGGITSPNGVTLNGKATVEVATGVLTLSGTVTGSGSLIKEGKGVLSLTGPSTYSGTTTIKRGTLQGSTKSVRGEVIDDGVLVLSQAFDGTFSGVIRGTGSLIKEGSGTVTLSQAHTYTGDTTVKGGHLKFTELKSRAFHLHGGHVHLEKGRRTHKVAALNGQRSTLYLYDNTLEVESGHFGGTLSGESGSLAKVGEGKLTLSGINTHAQQTMIKEGVLSVSSDASLGHAKASLRFMGGKLEVNRSLTSSRPIFLDEEAIIDVKPNAAIELNGTLSGQRGLKKTGVGTLSLTGNNAFQGALAIHRGVLKFSSEHNLGHGMVKLAGGLLSPSVSMTMKKPVLITSPSSIETAQGINLTFAPHALKGTDRIRKVGSGTLTFEGNHVEFLGKIDVQQGVMAVAGTLGGSVVVAPQAVIIGTGQVGPLHSKGTVRPGFSIGTLTVNGDYTQDPLAYVAFELQDASEKSSCLVVQGAAHLNGFVSLYLEPGLYAEGSTYTLLRAEKVRGTLSRLIKAHHPDRAVDTLVDVHLRHLTDQVQLEFLSAQLVFPRDISSLTGNAKSIATYMQLFAQTQSPDLQKVLRALTQVPADQLPQAFLQLGPQQFGALMLERLESHAFIQEQLTSVDLTDRLNNLNRHAIWISPIGYYYKQRLRDEQTPFHTKTYGVQFGFSSPLANHWVMGSGISYTNSDLRWFDARGDARIQSVYLSPVFGWETERAYAKGVISGSLSLYDVNRKIHLPLIKRRAKSNHASYDVSIGLIGGLKLQLPQTYADALFILPTCRLDYLTMFEEEYREERADALNLYVERKRSSFLRLDAKMKLLKHVYFGLKRISPSIYAGFINTTPLSTDKYFSKLREEVKRREKMVVRSYRSSTNQVSLGAELTSSNSSGGSINMGYEVRLGGRETIHEGKFNLVWKF